MRYVIAGGSGFLGQALRADLVRSGHEVVRLVRRPVRAVDESRWEPYSGQVDATVLAAADVVVNLAGATIGRPWTASYRDTIRNSRVATTATLAGAVARLDRPPVFVTQSAVNYYGTDRAADILDERAGTGDGFLPGVVRAWEAATETAERAGIRVVRLRTGVVLDSGGGAFPLMCLPFRLGVGGRLGSGNQYLPAVTRADWVRTVRFVAENAACRGPYNVSLPVPTTNAEFTRALGSALHRPTRLTVPAVVLERILGELSGQLLGSLRVVPARLLEAGFAFSSVRVEQLVALALHRTSRT